MVQVLWDSYALPGVLGDELRPSPRLRRPLGASVSTAAARISFNKVLTRKTNEVHWIWGFGDEKRWFFGGFSLEMVSWKCSGIKRLNTGIIYNISEQEKNTRVLNSKFRPRSEHDLCRQISDSARGDLYRVPCYESWYQICVFLRTNHAHFVVEIPSWKFLYFFPAQKCYK